LERGRPATLSGGHSCLDARIDEEVTTGRGVDSCITIAAEDHRFLVRRVTLRNSNYVYFRALRRTGQGGNLTDAGG
jgi:hypothetical protein